MSEELKPQAQNNAEATTNAQAKPAAEVSAAAKPAPALPNLPLRQNRLSTN